MAKFLNPVEKARKEAKKKEIKKNKKRRQEQRAESDKLKKQAAEEAIKNLQSNQGTDQPTEVPHQATNHPNHNKHHHHPAVGSYRPIPRPRTDQKVARTVPAAVSVIESKPAIIKPKISPFIPSSVRTKINKPE